MSGVWNYLPDFDRWFLLQKRYAKIIQISTRIEFMVIRRRTSVNHHLQAITQHSADLPIVNSLFLYLPTWGYWIMQPLCYFPRLTRYSVAIHYTPYLHRPDSQTLCSFTRSISKKKPLQRLRNCFSQRKKYGPVVRMHWNLRRLPGGWLRTHLWNLCNALRLQLQKEFHLQPLATERLWALLEYSDYLW